MGLVPVLTLGDVANNFSNWLGQFRLPEAADENSSCSTAMPILSIVSFFILAIQVVASAISLWF